MNRKYFLAVLSGVLVVIFSVGAHVARTSSNDNPYAYLTILSNVLHLVDANYVEEVDFSKVMDSAIDGMVENLDPESFYIKGKDLESYKKEVEQTKTLAGVGLTLARRYGMVTVIGVEKGSSADENDIKPGDYVRTVDDQYVQDLPLYRIYRMIKGAPSSTVKISFFEGALEKPKDFVLTRRALTRPYISSYVVSQPEIGYIRVNHLLPGVESDVEAKLKSFQEKGVDKMILDLRSCTDDQLDSAVRVADLFVGNTTITQISGREGSAQKINGDGKVAFKGKVLVLADYTTSSSAEILAGAMQDNGFQVYGTRTYGRGGIQKLIPAGDNYVMLTTQKYLTPKGKVILNNGIEPSIQFHDDVKAVRGEDNKNQDRMLDKAIEYMKHPDEKAA